MSSSKTIPHKCDKCKKDIPRREYLIYSQCNYKFDLGCANVPFVRFNIMDTERKSNWRCGKCISKPVKKPAVISPSISNVHKLPDKCNTASILSPTVVSPEQSDEVSLTPLNKQSTKY